MAFAPGKRTKDVLLWMLSTKMMPPVGALIPIYLLFKDSGLLDSRIGLIAVEFLINLPIIIWMLFTYFKEIPGEILEASRMDGATPWREIVFVLATGWGAAIDPQEARHKGVRAVLAKPYSLEELEHVLAA